MTELERELSAATPVRIPRSAGAAVAAAVGVVVLSVYVAGAVVPYLLGAAWASPAASVLAVTAWPLAAVLLTAAGLVCCPDGLRTLRAADRTYRLIACTAMALLIVNCLLHLSPLGVVVTGWVAD